MNRLHYIDIAKGILILMVIIGHYENATRQYIKCDLINQINSLEILWGSFFMPAFFLITGYCSNFHNKFKIFFLQNLKTLILPALIICLFLNWFDLLLQKETHLIAYRPSLKGLIISFWAPWFLPALFIGKNIFWLIYNHITEWKYRFIIPFCLMIVGFIAFNHFNESINIWYYKHSFILILFIAIGVYLKEKRINKRIELLLVATYIITISLMIVLKIHVPTISNRPQVNLYEIPILIILATTGSCSILYISKLIHKNYILEALGRNSLVIYLVHVELYKLSSPLFTLTDNRILKTTIIFLIPVLVTIISYMIATLLNKLEFNL